MKIQCTHCQTYNTHESILCVNCSKPLGNRDEIATKLLRRITDLEYNYHQEIKAIKKDITHFNNLESLDQEVQPLPREAPSKVVAKAEKVLEPQTIPIPKEEPVVVKPKVVPAPVEPSYLSIKIQEFLSPLHEGIELFSNVFYKYKKEGKLPIFFMTIAGIIAILFGFGYLMQISLASLGVYQVVAKIGLGIVSALVLIIIGVRVSPKSNTLKEFGSALIGLGIILNYLMVYFLSDLGNFPVLSSGLLGFGLIIVNTIVSIFLSLKYDAKVISIISLLGGAFTPLYLNALGDGTLYYLYLWFLAVGSSFVAKRMNWGKLNYLNFVIIMGSLEFMVFNQNPSNVVFVVYYHLFAYLFFYISLFDGLQLKSKIDKSEIIIVASTLSIFLYNLFNVFESNLLVLGATYIGNGFLFGSLLLKKWKDLNKDIKLILFVIIGALLGFAIPAIFDQQLMGLFWSIEALLLVILGFNFGIATVRKEGYILLGIAFFKLISSSLEITNLWDQTLWHQGFLNYVILGSVLTVMWTIGRKYKKLLDDFELKLFTYAQEMVPLWLASVMFILGYHLTGNWVFNLSIIPLFGFIYWKKHFNTKLTDVLGISHIILLIYGYITSLQSTHSFHFSDQELYAQLAIIQFMTTLWSLKHYYITIGCKENETYVFSQYLRILFFCILPLLVINLVKRQAFDYIEIGMWFSVVLSYFLFKKLQYKALLVEFYILSIAATYIGFLENDSLGFLSAILAVSTVVFSEKALDYETFKKSIFKEYLVISPFFIALYIGILLYSFDNDFFPLGSSVTAFILLVSTYFYENIGLIKDSKKTALITGLIINLISLISAGFYESIPAVLLVITNLILFGFLLNNHKNWFPILYGKLWNVMVIIHQLECIIVIALIVSFLGFDLSGPITSILLTAHAIVVLFVAMKNQIKVLNRLSIVLFALTLYKVVTNDIDGFESTEKVIVLIVLGILLLAASYGYVQLSKYFEEKTQATKNEIND